MNSDQPRSISPVIAATTASELELDGDVYSVEFRKIFRIFDHEDEGQMESTELRELLLRAGKNPADVNNLISEVDPNGNAKIRFEEFLTVVRKGIKRKGSRNLRTDDNEDTVLELMKILDAYRRKCEEDGDYRTAAAVKKRYLKLKDDEERRRHQAIASRQNAERTGVDEAHMMEAMEFNSAWSQNMSEFERQAREIEEQMKERHALEFQKIQAQLRSEPQRTTKFSKELLNIRSIQRTLAKQGAYADAEKVKEKADEMERWETMKMENELQRIYATKELKFRQRQQQELAALQKRIQRGREEHKQHWQVGAQRLMQSHRNMTNDLKNRQNIENIKAVVSVKTTLSSPSSSAFPRSNSWSDVKQNLDPEAHQRPSRSAASPAFGM